MFVCYNLCASMIGMLTGTVVYTSDPYIIIDVHGVGYRVMVPQRIISSLPTLAEEDSSSQLKLFIHTHVREDLLELYGFTSPHDLALFEQLISVSGVGCKSAMGIFAIGDRETIISAIQKADASFFMTVPRLGKKNAQKIIIELKNKLGSLQELDLADDIGSEADEIVAALTSFGYSAREAQRALQGIKGQGTSTSERVRLALKYLGK